MESNGKLRYPIEPNEWHCVSYDHIAGGGVGGKGGDLRLTLWIEFEKTYLALEIYEE